MAHSGSRCTRRRRALGVRTALVVPLGLVLAGCVGGGIYAAQQAPALINAGLNAYRATEVYREGDRAFVAEENTPSESQREALRAAESLALYPVFEGAEGRVVDTAREHVSLAVVEPSRTVRWARARTVQVSALSRSEKVAHLARLGAATGADLVLLTEYAGINTPQNLFPPETRAQYVYDTIVVETASERILWTERHAVAADDLASLNSPDTQRLLVEGIARRLESLRDASPPAVGDVTPS